MKFNFRDKVRHRIDIKRGKIDIGTIIGMGLNNYCVQWENAGTMWNAEHNLVLHKRRKYNHPNTKLFI